MRLLLRAGGRPNQTLLRVTIPGMRKVRQAFSSQAHIPYAQSAAVARRHRLGDLESVMIDGYPAESYNEPVVRHHTMRMS